MICELILLLAVSSGIASVILYYIKRWHLLRSAMNFPGPAALPFFGNALFFAIGGNDKLLDKATWLCKTYPSPCRIWLGHRLVIVLNDAEQIKNILLNPNTIEKEELYKFLRPWLGDGLITASGNKWRVNRKLIMPTFNQRILDNFVDVFSETALLMTRRLEAEVDKGPFDVIFYMAPCTLDMICETAMGVSQHCQTNKNDRYFASTVRVAEILIKRIFSLWLHPDFIFKLTPMGRDHDNVLKYVQAVADDVIQKKRQDFQKKQTTKDKDAHIQEFGPRKVFLDFLMELSQQNGNKYTNRELRDEVNTMIAAGSETTAVVNTYTLLMLANYPEIQEKVYDELFEIYGSSDPEAVPVKSEDLHRMKYLECVIKETLRLFPLAPLIVRLATDDVSIGEYTIPKGSSAAILILHLHRNEKYWPDPLRFDPDRFLPENSVDRHPYCFIPFSAGPRNCLGMKYAMMAMKTLISTVVRKYKFKNSNVVPVDKMKLKVDILLKPVEPIKLQIERRN